MFGYIESIRKLVSKSSTLRAWSFLVLVGQLYNSLKAMRNYRSLPEITPVIAEDRVCEDFSGVSIIVPARNEQANVPRLLNSLVRQNYLQYEVIVVDDASTDNTAAIVRTYAEELVQLISIDGPPEGWTGKNHACWIGAGHARYPWLLFVDADAELAPCALSSTMHFVIEQDASALSLFPHQRCETFWERLLLPFAFQHYFVGTNAKVNASDGPALANGQYFLIHRHAYEEVHGHAANAASIVDDAALALSLKRAGIVPLTCRGEELVSVRMYTNLRQIASGFGKNVYPYLQQSLFTGVQTVLSTTLASAVPLLFVDAYREKSYTLFFMAILAYIVQVLGALSWFRHFHIPLRYSLLTPIAALTFLAIAINSFLHTIVGHSLVWKGRSYTTYQQSPVIWFLSLVNKKRQKKRVPKAPHAATQRRMLASGPVLLIVGSLLHNLVSLSIRKGRN